MISYQKSAVRNSLEGDLERYFRRLYIIVARR
jgi:hypothetical protein